MVRQLKYHEQKLLKKHDFLQWKSSSTDKTQQHAAQVIHRYQLPSRDTYTAYNKLIGQIRHLVHLLSLLEPTHNRHHPTDTNTLFRVKMEKQLTDKLYDLGLIPSKSLGSSALMSLSVSSLCRRRLPTVLCRLKMSESIQEATRMIQEGHVRVGPDVVTDPGLVVSRRMEDYVTWVSGSKYKRRVMKYHDKLDDFDLLD